MGQVANKNGHPKLRGKYKRSHERLLVRSGPRPLTKARATRLLKEASNALKKALEVLAEREFQEVTAVPDVICGIDFYAEVGRFEKALILQALEYSQGHQKYASSLLGLKPTTLNEKLKAYDIETKRFPNRRIGLENQLGNPQPATATQTTENGSIAASGSAS
jgi:DNA-binding protein Fis